MKAAHMADLFDMTRWGEEFSRDEVEIIAAHLSLVNFADGECIFREGDREDFMAFIVSGQVDIAKESGDDMEAAIVTLHPRTHLGEMAFVDGEPRSATARARGDVTLLVLTKAHFQSILAENPDIGVKMLMKIAKLLSRRLRQTTGKLVTGEA
ncbi:cyclic nucleotide-binding domain-containing protein [Desulfolutivibrio sulfoxidireducens]|uniref:cyclic nucleotide-binding domain-containing protein n=1 Tax=Desulfolutivibrio sulfoxidireducens TaxID=2773299 RepID=UPI00159D477E|nr:cyclic nucleotide-binding domain-containing protein [Desulfolutivibrio sulfoxidireducens]